MTDSGPAATSTADAPPVDVAPASADRGTTGMATEVQSSDAVRQYRLALAREAGRSKRYPAIARERGWEGLVVVSVGNAPGVPVPWVRLNQSSGFAVIDEEAVALVGRAVRGAALPEGLAGRSFSVNLPIHYRLAD